ncbi:MAG: type IX secretion system sortase PorU, partial [Bacteroidales bacterium]|nr:type IX secretion system sortase PorU [Bacteroidales bacterium]
MKNLFAVFCWLMVVCGSLSAQSPMASGEWYRMFITQDGIYRITYEELLNLGLSNPANVRIYGAGGAMLPEMAGSVEKGLQEIPVRMVCKTAGVFAAGDYILFYGQGTVVWRYNKTLQKFEHSLHLWDKRSVCFITSGTGGKRITADVASASAVNREVFTFDEHLVQEEELSNIINSGRFWYGAYFGTAPQIVSFTVPDLAPDATALVDGAVLTHSRSNPMMDVRYNSQTVGNVALSAYHDEYAVEDAFTATIHAASNPVSIELSLNKNGGSADVWLDYLRLSVRRKLNFSSSPLFFRDTQSVGAGNIARFSISNSSSDVQVWDVSDMYNVRQMNTGLSGSTLSFEAETDTLREFVAFRLSDGLLKPDIQKERLPNQNLHGMDADMLIVTNAAFTDAAKELAELHRQNDGLTVETVTDEQVYNEFSGGKQDPAAIRNFAKTVYEQSHRLKYLLLVGDGSFDNKSNLTGKVNSNYIVTYQSVESLHNTQSYVSDDYFGILDDGAGILGGNLNIGVGRLPVQTAEEAQNVVNKIRQYMKTPATGDWANLMALLADDEDQNIHSEQSDSIAEYLRVSQPQYTVEKLYLDAFRQTPTADGHRYPEVTERLNEILNNGCFVVNYIGHGNASGLSEERVVNATLIDSWKNRICPLFVVATCEFGRYDDYQRVTAGEKTLLNPKGGSIALLTSTRLVYSSLNFQLSKNFFRALFATPFDGSTYRIGDFVRLSKNASGASVNKLCFTLLGDPALRLPIPSNKVRTLSVNGNPMNDADTLRANANVTLRAEVTNRAGQRLTDFNGVAQITVFDKARETSTLDNDHNALPMQFTVQTSVLYRGKATVSNGILEATFIMPRDINYQYGTGKISYFAWSDQTQAAGGDTITVGGSVAAIEDYAGPEIRLFMNDTLFRDGGIT